MRDGLFGREEQEESKMTGMERIVKKLFVANFFLFIIFTAVRLLRAKRKSALAMTDLQGKFIRLFRE